jgi:hypothetical protein
MINDTDRELAAQRLQQRNSFFNFIIVWAGVAALLTAVWAVSGMGEYWPAWVIGAMAIAVFVKAYNAFGPGKSGITSSAIDAEAARIASR